MKERENGKETEERENGKETEERLSLVLADSYKYDGKEVKVLDMEGLVDLTAQDLCEIDRKMIQSGYQGARLEVTRQYAMLVAAKVDGKPWDYCDRMKARDSIRLRDMVTAFFFARA